METISIEKQHGDKVQFGVHVLIDCWPNESPAKLDLIIQRWAWSSCNEGVEHKCEIIDNSFKINCTRNQLKSSFPRNHHFHHRFLDPSTANYQLLDQLWFGSINKLIAFQVRESIAIHIFGDGNVIRLVIITWSHAQWSGDVLYHTTKLPLDLNKLSFDCDIYFTTTLRLLVDFFSSWLSLLNIFIHFTSNSLTGFDLERCQR